MHSLSHTDQHTMDFRAVKRVPREHFPTASRIADHAELARHRMARLACLHGHPALHEVVDTPPHTATVATFWCADTSSGAGHWTLRRCSTCATRLCPRRSSRTCRASGIASSAASLPSVCARSQQIDASKEVVNVQIKNAELNTRWAWVNVRCARLLVEHFRCRTRLDGGL
jgi:hypothetical protein